MNDTTTIAGATAVEPDPIATAAAVDADHTNLADPGHPAALAGPDPDVAPGRPGREGNPVAALFRTLRERTLGLATDQRGMSTVEYALGTVAAAAFGALLYTVVTGGQITEALTDIIERALNTQ